MSAQGGYIRLLRDRKGMSLETVAKSVGMTKQMLSGVELGTHQMPKRRISSVIKTLDGDIPTMIECMAKDFQKNLTNFVLDYGGL